MKRLYPLILLLMVAGCFPETSSMRRDAFNERCSWMGREALLFSASRAKGTTRDQALKQVESVDLKEPEQASKNRQELGVPDERDDLRDIVNKVYDADPSIPPDQLAAKMNSECTASIPQ